MIRVALASLLLLPPLAAMPCDQKLDVTPRTPRLRVETKIEDPDITTRSLQLPEIASVERDVADKLPAHLSALIPFVEWLPTPTGDVDGTLTLHLRQFSDGSDNLNFTYTGPHGKDELNDAPRCDLFAATDYTRPIDNPADLIAAITGALDAYFRDDTKTTTLKTVLFTSIPLMFGIGIDTCAPHTEFILPIPWNAVNPSRNTIFLVRFAVHSKTSRHVPIAEIYLAPSHPYQNESGYIVASPNHECVNHRYRFDAHQTPSAQNTCDPLQPGPDHLELLPYLSEKATRDAVEIYMVKDGQAHSPLSMPGIAGH